MKVSLIRFLTTTTPLRSKTYPLVLLPTSTTTRARIHSDLHQHRRALSAMTSTEEPTTINLLQLAAAAISASISAAEPIREYSSQSNHARLKQDGSVVTDADFMAQGRIVRTLLRSNPSVTIVGEESSEEMQSHLESKSWDETEASVTYRLAQREVNSRVRQRQEGAEPPTALPLAPGGSVEDEEDTIVDEQHVVDSSRVRVFVDPLDGTNSYAKGDFDAVTILIAIVVDNIPSFGVICKPFRYSEYPTVLDTGCVVLYGGLLLDGVYLAGVSEPCQVFAPKVDSLPRAVISSSRSKGIVANFCRFLADKGMIDPEPLAVSGAGEKSLRLLLGTRQETLWFFPRPGTSRWDVAASDALLRALGGKLSNKFGQDLDYATVTRETAENTEGIISSNSSELHAECVRLFAEYQAEHGQE